MSVSQMMRADVQALIKAAERRLNKQNSWTPSQLEGDLRLAIKYLRAYDAELTRLRNELLAVAVAGQS